MDNITTEELVAVWPTLDTVTKQAITIAVLRRRLEDSGSELAQARHQIELLEQAVKNP